MTRMFAFTAVVLVLASLVTGLYAREVKTQEAGRPLAACRPK